jgi:outer membrane protein
MATRVRIAIAVCFLGVTTASATELVGTVSIDECLDVALRQHPGIAAANADVQAAGQRVRRARSRLMPQIDGSYNFTRQEQTLSSLISGPSGTIAAERKTTFNFQRAGFGLTQLLFDFGKTFNQTREARARKDSTEANRETVEDRVILNVRTAYYVLIAAARLLVVAQDTEAQTRRQLEEARSRYEVGTAPRFDVTQQEVQVATAELARLTASNNVALGRENLRDAMGLTQPIAFEPDDRTLDYHGVKTDASTAVERAFVHRPELRAIAALKRAQEQRIAAFKKDYLPFVTGLGGYNWSGSDTPSDESWAIGANVSLSIFNGFRTAADVGESRAELLRLEADERLERQRVTLEVRKSYLELRRAEDSIRVSSKAVEQARESLDVAEGRYSAGVGNILEVSEAQVALARARADNVEDLADYWVAVAALERAIGAPLEGTTDGNSEKG